MGPFGCGTERSFAEYEAYAGLNFTHQVAQDATLQGLEPPNPPAIPNWATDVREWQVRIVLDRGSLPREAVEAPQFWYVGVHDASSTELHRRDLMGDELQQMLDDPGALLVIERRFNSAKLPTRWTVWPVSSDGEWLPRLEGIATPICMVQSG